MARLENATYEEIVTHLERELLLNGHEEGDDIHFPTMSTAPTATRPGTGLLSSGIDPNVTCSYCKKPGHVKDDCRNFKRKEEQKATTGRIPRKNIQKVQLATKRITRRNGFGKALDSTSSTKTSNRIIPKPRKQPWVKMTPTINLILPFLTTRKSRFATTSL